MEQKLIESVRIRPIMYDINHDDYMKSKLKNKKWEEIAKEVGMKCGTEAKTLWEKLRHSLRDAMRRKQKMFQNGASAQTVKNWKFEKQMAFLLPHMANRSRIGNVRDDETSNSEEISMQQEIESEEDDAEKEEFHETSLSSSAKKFKKDNMAAVPNYTLEHCHERADDRKGILENSQNDSLFHFFMSMYESTKRMPPIYQHTVKSRVFHVVSGIEATLLNLSSYEEYILSDTQSNSNHSNENDVKPS